MEFCNQIYSYFISIKASLNLPIKTKFFAIYTRGRITSFYMGEEGRMKLSLEINYSLEINSVFSTAFEIYGSGLKTI